MWNGSYIQCGSSAWVPSSTGYVAVNNNSNLDLTTGSPVSAAFKFSVTKPGIRSLLFDYSFFEDSSLLAALSVCLDSGNGLSATINREKLKSQNNVELFFTKELSVGDHELVFSLNTSDSQKCHANISNLSFGIQSDAAVPTPIPSAVWFLGSGLAGLAGMRRRARK